MNILLIVADQQRADLIGCVGRVPVKTPALDRLAAEGILFTRAYTCCPLCTPARASLLSGQYPSRHRAWSIGVNTPEDILSLPALLHDQAGYDTAIIGKSHFRSCLDGESPESLPHSRDWNKFEHWNGPWYGFDHAEICNGHTSQAHAYAMHYGLWLHQNGIPAAPPYFDEIGGGSSRDQETHWELPEQFHNSTWIADRSIAWIEHNRNQNPQRPFFLSVNFQDPHRPFRVPAPWDTMYSGAEPPPAARCEREWEDKPTLYRATVEGQLTELGWEGSEGIRLPCQMAEGAVGVERSEVEKQRWWTYMGMQSLLDKNVGRILDALDSNGLAENTLVIYTADHGDYMGDHYLWSKGGSHYDGAVRIPLIARWPERLSAGTRNTNLQSLVDLPPTIMAATGLQPHPAMQGRSRLQNWSGSDKAEPTVHSDTRKGVFIDHRVEEGLYVSTWITNRYRLSLHSILAESRDEIELYDLERDPHEYHNLAMEKDRQTLIQELLAEMYRYRMKIEAPWPRRRAFS